MTARRIVVLLAALALPALCVAAGGDDKPCYIERYVCVPHGIGGCEAVFRDAASARMMDELLGGTALAFAGKGYGFASAEEEARFLRARRIPVDAGVYGAVSAGLAGVLFGGLFVRRRPLPVPRPWRAAALAGLLLSVAGVLTSIAAFNPFAVEQANIMVFPIELTRGSAASPLEYAVRPFTGFTCLNSLLYLPVFLAFKGTVAGSLVFCLAWKAGMGLLLYYLGKKYYGGIAALTAVFLFAFGPYAYSSFSMIGVDADHYYISAFILIMFILLFSLVSQGGSGILPAARARAAAAGAVGGFSVYLMPAGLIFAGYVFAVLVAAACTAGRRELRKVLVPFLAGAALGALPRVAFMALTGDYRWAFRDGRVRSMDAGGGIALPGKAYDAVTFNLRWAFVENMQPDRQVWADLCYFAALVFMVFFILRWAAGLLRKERPEAGRPMVLVGAVLVHCSVVGLMDPGAVRSRYFFCVFPLLFLVIGAGIQTLWREGARAGLRGRLSAAFAVAVTAAVLAAGAGNTAYLWERETPRASRAVAAMGKKAYSVTGYLYLWRGGWMLRRDYGPEGRRLCAVSRARVEDPAEAHAYIIGILLADRVQRDDIALNAVRLFLKTGYQPAALEGYRFASGFTEAKAVRRRRTCERPS